jgi:hypothetical protein
MPSEPKDQVRLLISDVGGADQASFLFTDDEIQTFLDLRQGNVHLAAATALRATAGNEALVSKAITFLDLKTNGPAVAAAMQSLANDYERQADDDVDPDIVEMVTTPFAQREIRGWERAG